MNLSSLGSGQMSRPDPAEFFKKADTDGSGGISKEELATALKNGPQRADGTQKTPDVDKIFAEVDTDGDGQISETENTAHMESMAKGHGPHGGGPMKGSSDQFAKLIQELKKALSSSSTSTDSSTTSSDSASDSTSTSDSSDSTSDASAGTGSLTDEELTKVLSQILDKLKQSGEATNLFSAKA